MPATSARLWDRAGGELVLPTSAHILTVRVRDARETDESTSALSLLHATNRVVVDGGCPLPMEFIVVSGFYNRKAKSFEMSRMAGQGFG